MYRRQATINQSLTSNMESSQYARSTQRKKHECEGRSTAVFAFERILFRISKIKPPHRKETGLGDKLSKLHRKVADGRKKVPAEKQTVGIIIVCRGIFLFVSSALDYIQQ